MLLSASAYAKMLGQTVTYTYNEQGGCTSRVSTNTSKKSKNAQKPYSESSQIGVTVSPPASFSDKLTISFTGTNDVHLTYILANISGQVFLNGTLTTNEVSLSTARLPKGVYILKVSGEDYDQSYKLLKK